MIWLVEDNLLLIQNIMDLGLTQEIDRLNNEVDTLRSQVTFWEEKSDHRKERIKELKEENEVLLDNNVPIKIMNENQSVKEINESLVKKIGEIRKEKNKSVCGDLHNLLVNKLKGDIEKLKKDIAEVREERFWFGDALMKVKDDIDKILYGDKDGCPYEYDTSLKPASVNLWNSWEVRIQSIEELKKEYDELSDNYENLINTNFQTESDEDINK